MTETPPPGNTATPAPQAGRWRRSRYDRMVAGVCGGVAEALAVDPIVIRVFLVVLTCFGGAGAVAYVAGWLLMPDGDDEAIVHGVLRRRPRGGRGRALVPVVLGSVALVVTIRTVFHHHDGGPLLALVLVGAFLLGRRARRPGSPAALSRPAASEIPFGPSTPTAPITPVDPTPMSGPAQAESPFGLSTPTAPRTPPRPAVPRSPLGRTVACLVLIGLGVLAAADTLGADVPLPAYPALVLTGAGLGLLVATRYGRARGLVALGMLGALALPPTAFAQEFTGPIAHHETRIAPTSTAALPPLIEYRAGDVQIDLSGLDLAGGNYATTIRLGAGRLRVTLPPHADATVHTQLVAGRQELLGADTEGFDHRRTVHDILDGPGVSGTLDLTVQQGAGFLQIVRASDASTGAPRAQA